jgi:hypothetical protein
MAARTVQESNGQAGGEATCISSMHHDGSGSFGAASFLCGHCGVCLSAETVADTEDRQIAVLQDGARCGHATRTKGKHKAAARNARCSGE